MVIIAFIVGLFMGSLAQAVAFRVEAGQNWLSDRSECDHCKKKLDPIDLIPVVSWVIFLGACRRCKKKLSPEYPLVELGSGAIFALSVWQWPYELASNLDYALLAVWGVILTVLIMLFVSDLHWKVLPNGMVLTLAILAVAFRGLMVATGVVELQSALVGSAIGIFVGGGIFYILFQASGGRWLGGGDVKYGWAVGIFLGGIGAYLMLMIASFAGSLLIGGLMLVKKIDRKAQIPFGPFLIFATVMAFLFLDPLREAIFSGAL